MTTQTLPGPQSALLRHWFPAEQSAVALLVQTMPPSADVWQMQSLPRGPQPVLLLQVVLDPAGQVEAQVFPKHISGEGQQVRFAPVPQMVLVEGQQAPLMQVPVVQQVVLAPLPQRLALAQQAPPRQVVPVPQQTLPQGGQVVAASASLVAPRPSMPPTAPTTATRMAERRETG